MRRLIGYITLCIAILLGVGVAFVPVLSQMNTDMNYSTYYEVVYQLNQWDDSESEIESETAAQEIADVMATRLDTYGIDSYDVKVEGRDSIRVSFTSQGDTTVKENIEDYLAFSGGDFTLTNADASTQIDNDVIFANAGDAYIVYDAYVPYVIIPVTSNTEINALVESLSSSEEEEGEETTEEEESASADIYLWANWELGDTVANAEVDPNKAAKLVASFYSANIWYPDSDNEETEIQYLCGYADDEGNYDVTRVEEANNLAVRVCNMLNASSYDYEVTMLYENSHSAKVESIVNYGASLSLSWSLTLIATLVAIVVIGLILALFYRITALGIFSNTIGTIFLTAVLFTFLNSTFNVAALVAFIAVTIASLSMGIYYAHSYKEEIYKGRAPKKAYQEASKKIMMPTVDIAVILLAAGLMCYFAGGNFLLGAGVIFFFGALFVLVMNLLVFRLMNYFLSGATNISTDYKVFAIEEKMVPDLTKEEKPTYEGPYENKDFSKNKKPIGIVSAVFLLASIVGIAVFGATTGYIYNVGNYTTSTTQVYVVLNDVDNPNPAITDEVYFSENVLAKVRLNNDQTITYNNVETGTYTYTSYNETELEEEIVYTYYSANIARTFADTDTFSYLDENGTLQEAESLEDAINSIVSYTVGSADDFTDVKISTSTSLSPNNGWLFLATSMTIVLSCFYFIFRYGIARALASCTVSLTAVGITMGFFTLTRIPVSPVIGVAMVAVAVYSLLLSSIILNKDREMRKEHKEVLTLDEKLAISLKAVGIAAAPALILAIIALYLGINYFGFGPQSYMFVFCFFLIGIVLASVLVFTIMIPLSGIFDKGFKKISQRMPKIKRTKKAKPKNTSSEPEETIFIGIND